MESCTRVDEDHLPPVFGSFRKALKDTEYGGYDIPKGWQVFWVSYGTHMNKEIFEKPKSLIHQGLRTHLSQFLPMLIFHLEEACTLA
ncbi:taxadiene 5-alpha hydroxylase-like [Prunus yedoensis var. nudiflora]|uniref:Taxadiene 5-alpha hydroxylase-like n=1 Tax=Prunus yedoensis var. nudiflora TaxID=2094558 RepID=A0A314UZZ0_PRUYE|nr:taxadiene 5-alpha hydroxylase-like [Prunus yedoensis var. nudiflora]